MNEVIRVSHGLWKSQTEVTDLAGRCAALLQILPDGSVFAGRTAAELLGLWMPSLPSPRIDVILRRDGLRPRDLAASRRGEVRTRRRSLRSDEICLAHGLPVTTPERTWVDLAEELRAVDLVACGDSVLRSNVSLPRLTDALKRAAGRRGVRRARALIELLDARSRSRAESHLRYAVVSAGLPSPEVNVPIYNSHGEWLAEPDLVYREATLALEYNGADHAKVKRMRNDITRAIDVHVGQWLSIAFGPAQVFGRPWEIGPVVRTTLHERAPDYLREWRETRRVARNIAPLAG